MNVRDSEFDRLLAEWLEDDSFVSPAAPVEAAVNHARSHPRRRDWLALLRRDAMTTHPTTGLRPVAILVAIVALLVLAVGGAVLIGSRPEATPTPRIAFEAECEVAGEIYTMNADGSDVLNLTNSGAPDSDPAWSPDRTRIAFTSIRDDNGEIYTMNPDGSDVVRLTDNPAYDSGPAWSPDGTKITFSSERDGGVGNSGIYTMNADGSDVVRLTNADAAPSWSPEWSPDGTRIVFVRRDPVHNEEIYTMNADGSDVVNLTNRARWDFSPAWSPDGTKIAWTSGGIEAFAIYTMNADGSDVVLTKRAPAGAPAWSPDGTKIAFVAGAGSSHDIYTMNADGSDQVRLTSDPGCVGGLSW